jgi:ATP-dependent DNA ligase
LKLYSRPGNDLTYRFPLIVETIAKLRSRSCIIDGEAVACGEHGIASFDRIRYRHNDDGVFLYAFDLIELDSDDLRRNPLIVRRRRSELNQREYCEARGFRHLFVFSFKRSDVHVRVTAWVGAS